MRIWGVYISLAVLSLVHSLAFAATKDQLLSIGVINVKDYGAKGDGVTDDTQAIQRGINASRTSQCTLLFPEGTYLVSDTLECYKPGRHKQTVPHLDGGIGKTFCIVGSSKGSRPVIKLKDNCAPYFNRNIGEAANYANSTPVLHFSAFKDVDRDLVWDYVDANGNGIPEQGEGKTLTDSDGEQFEETNNGANAFGMQIRNIDFDLGTGNTSAVAIYGQIAQSCGIEDIDIKATGAFGGLRFVTGTNSLTGNILVDGGKVGIVAAAEDNGCINGIRLRNQTEYALFRANRLPTTMVGFEIIKNKPPAIGFSGNTKRSHDFAMIDGTIEFTAADSNPAIDNTPQNNLYMHDVYIKNAATLVKSGSYAAVRGGTGWKRIIEYASADKNEGWNMVKPNGSEWSLTRDQIVDVVNCTEAQVPRDFVRRHIWDEEDFPSPDDVFDRAAADGNPYDADECVVAGVQNNVPADDTPPDDEADSVGPDCRAGLQALIDAGCKWILLPNKKYLVKKNPVGDFGIKLGMETILLGVKGAEIRSHDEWNPTSEMPVMTTEDSAQAASKVGWVKFGYVHSPGTAQNPLAYDWFNAYDWRAGTMSVLRHVGSNVCPASGKKTTNNRSSVKFSGNAGGRHFAIGSGGATAADGPGNYRRIKVQDTSNPLAIYNPNMEDGVDLPQFEIIDSSNVIIYGTKAENDDPLGFTNSSNCAVIGYGGHAELKVRNSTDILAAIICGRMGTDHDGYPPLQEIPGSKYPNGDTVGLYKRGEFNWDAVDIIPESSEDTKVQSDLWKKGY